ncbi:hypothetical protein [Candidatus Hakubella thermalkaliphila]|uniref:ribonuclease toxin HepT-like protein n=1 Tax=Candidatus Hakubella thermalkaliphila TaxID=2754717 RepID=UPI001594065D|nr:hypothetical protein [Candidatus Hakubella thermalkaliphila]
MDYELNQLLSGISGEPTFIFVRATGSILHDFYCGAEKIFQRIAVEVDGELPKGEDWHTELLKRMTIQPYFYFSVCLLRQFSQTL